MTANMQKLKDLVAELMKTKGLSYDDAWRELRRQHPELFPTPPPPKGSTKFEVKTKGFKRETKAFVDVVNELQKREGLSFDTAWSEARRRNPALYQACNELPPGSQLSADAQLLVGEWPVPPAVLGALGLPMAATREMYLIWKTAERVKTVTPEMAAKILVVLTQFQQLTQGMTFDETWKALKKHFPDIFTKLDEVGSANEQLGGAAAADPAQVQGVNSSDAGATFGFGPTVPTLRHA